MITKSKQNEIPSFTVYMYSYCTGIHVVKDFEIRLFQTLKYDTKTYYLQYYVDNVFKSVTHW